MTAIKGRPGDFHRFVNAEICHKSWCFYIFYYSMYLLKICVVYFSKDLFQKEKKCEIFDTGRILTVFQGSQTRD